MRNEEVMSRSRLKREAMSNPQSRKRLMQKEPTPICDQPMPSSAEGWCEQIPEDPTLYVAAVKVIRLSDASTKKFYLVLVRPSEVKEMKKRVKKLAKRIKAENEAAAKKETRRAVRAVLFALGKV